MPFPAARLGDLTATGDAITGPGAATVFIMGRPAARVTSTVVGVNPATGVPVTTAIMKGAIKTLIA